MPSLYLHAGAPKTGTSYLQVLFAKHAEDLVRCGVVYPRGHLFDEAKAGQITSGNGVEMANYIRPGLPHVIQDKDAFIHELDAQLRGAARKHVLYSSEFLFFEPGERTRSVADAAARHGYDIRVVYLVRDIATAAYSTYSQLIKRHGDTRTFVEFIPTWKPLYRLNIQRAVDAFGADKLMVFNFEEHRDRLADLFFRDILGASFVPEERATINRSLSPREAELLRIMNAVHPGNVKLSTFVSDALMRVDVPSGSCPVGKTEAEHLEHLFAAEVDFVNRFVRGRPIAVARHITDESTSAEITESERAMLAILARLVAAVVNH